MFLIDGHPTAIVQPCNGTRLTEISVADETIASVGAASPVVGKFWGITDLKAEHPVAQIRLLETAPGWQPRTMAAGSQLTEFVSDRGYEILSSITVASDDRDSRLHFTLADLKSLTDGELWAAPTPFAQPGAMTREQFRQHVAASC